MPEEPAKNKPTKNVDLPKTRTWPWVLAGVAAVVLAFGGGGGWASTVPLSSAVVASGLVIVDTNRKQIQHLEGGIVASLHMRDGSYVKSGEVLLRLDNTRASASLAIVKAAYREELAKEARFIAERDGKRKIIWPKPLLGKKNDPLLSALKAGQQGIFISRRETLQGETDILRERIKQLDQEIGGLGAQKTAAQRQTDLVRQELASLAGLLKEGLITRQRVLALQREEARLEGKHGELTANIARAHKAVGETRLEIIQKRKAFQTAVVSALRDVQAKINDLRERFIASEDVLNRLDIRAPVAGMVVNLKVHSRNAVIRPADTILEIVPSGDRLLVEVRVQPQDIDNISIGQETDVRVLAFKQRTTPTLKARVSYVSADAMTNAQERSTYYIARILIPQSELKRLKGQALKPGMPAEVMIQTGKRTALAYMIQPILDSVNRAWREQ